MKNLLMLGLLLVITIMATYATSTATPKKAQVREHHWGYEGSEGPEHWGDLGYPLCADGKNQSPINIPDAAPIHSADIAFQYKPTALNIVNNGHTIQVNYDKGSTIRAEGKTYQLLQFHFHAPSEHTIQGKYFDMELHLVHQSAEGEYAVLGVMIKRGARNRAYGPIWDHFPVEEGEPETIGGVNVNADDLLPEERNYYRYDGSFTTPPCTEGINWFVFSTPVELSDGQIAAFEKIYNHNNRPVQPLYWRKCF